MNEEKEFAINVAKSGPMVLINVTILSICFLLFTFIITIKPELLVENTFLTLQLVCAIPLISSSMLARAKLGYTHNARKWNMLGYITFLLAYTFLINSIGILLMTLLPFWIVAIFYSINILSALAYSAIEISYDRSKIKERVVKDLFFIALIVLLGILPVL